MKPMAPGQGVAAVSVPYTVRVVQNPQLESE
jgi:hypothetical protein